MKIKYLGHASFLITAQDNTKIVIDPYNVGHGIKYSPIDESADIVTVSHGHGDHSNSAAIKGGPTVINAAGVKEIKGIQVKGIAAYHDGTQGTQRGNDVVFCFNVDGLNICHTGDLGHQFTPQQLSEIGPVDILLIPVGGFFTIDAKEAGAVVQSLKPRVVIPMHFKTPKADFPLAPVDDFLKDKQPVRRLNSSEVEFKKDNLPKEMEIVVLQPAL